MQFTSNSDFPAGNLHTLQWAQIAQHPIQFDDANFESCASITTRVIIQSDGMLNNTGVTTSNVQHVKVGAENYIVKTAKGVLVRTSSIINGQSSSLESTPMSLLVNHLLNILPSPLALEIMKSLEDSLFLMNRLRHGLQPLCD